MTLFKVCFSVLFLRFPFFFPFSVSDGKIRINLFLSSNKWFWPAKGLWSTHSLVKIHNTGCFNKCNFVYPNTSYWSKPFLFFFGRAEICFPNFYDFFLRDKSPLSCEVVVASDFPPEFMHMDGTRSETTKAEFLNCIFGLILSIDNLICGIIYFYFLKWYKLYWCAKSKCNLFNNWSESISQWQHYQQKVWYLRSLQKQQKSTRNTC